MELINGSLLDVLVAPISELKGKLLFRRRSSLSHSSVMETKIQGSGLSWLLTQVVQLESNFILVRHLFRHWNNYKVRTVP